MAEFVVAFHKTLCGSDGHPRRCCQGRVRLEAPDEAAASERAKRIFASSHGIPSWDYHADEFDTAPVPTGPVA